MPLYDYSCVTCGDFREFRPMRESTVSQVCPLCGARSERVIAAPFLAAREPSSGGAPQPNAPTSFRRRCGHAHGCSH
jgi:putative FmdB family regulatory protein